MDAIAAFGCSWVSDTSGLGNFTDMSSDTLRLYNSPPLYCIIKQNVIEIIAINEFQHTEDSKSIPTLF